MAMLGDERAVRPQKVARGDVWALRYPAEIVARGLHLSGEITTELPAVEAEDPTQLDNGVEAGGNRTEIIGEISGKVLSFQLHLAQGRCISLPFHREFTCYIPPGPSVKRPL